MANVYQYHPQNSVIEDFDQSHLSAFNTSTMSAGGIGSNSTTNRFGMSSTNGNSVIRPANGTTTSSSTYNYNNTPAKSSQPLSSSDTFMDDSSYFNQDESLHIPVTPIPNRSAFHRSNSNGNLRPQPQTQSQPQPTIEQQLHQSSTQYRGTPSRTAQTQQTRPPRDEFAFSTYQDNFAAEADNIVEAMKQSTINHRRNDINFSYPNQNKQQQQQQQQQSNGVNTSSTSTPGGIQFGGVSGYQTTADTATPYSYVKNLEASYNKLSEQFVKNKVNQLNTNTTTSTGPVQPSSTSTTPAQSVPQQPVHNQPQYQPQPQPQPQNTSNTSSTTTTPSFSRTGAVNFTSPAATSTTQQTSAAATGTPMRTVNSFSMIEMTNKYAAAMSDLKDEQARYHDKENEYNQLLETHQEILMRYDSERKVRTSVEKECDRLRFETTEFKRQMQKLIEENDRYLNELHQLQEQKKVVERRMNDALHHQQQLETENNDLHQTLNGIQNDMNLALQGFNEKEKKVNDQLNDWKEQFSQAKQKHELDASHLNQVNDQLTQQNTQLKQLNAQLNQQIGQLKQDADKSQRQLHSDMVRLKSTLQQNETIARELEESKKHNRQTYLSQQTKIDALQAQLKGKQEEYERQLRDVNDNYESSLKLKDSQLQMKINEIELKYKQQLQQQLFQISTGSRPPIPPTSVSSSMGPNTSTTTTPTPVRRNPQQQTTQPTTTSQTQPTTPTPIRRNPQQQTAPTSSSSTTSSQSSFTFAPLFSSNPTRPPTSSSTTR